MNWLEKGRAQRVQRALDRQLEYQRRKSAAMRGHEPTVIALMSKHSREVRHKLERIRPVAEDAPVLEVGCGANGLIFFFGSTKAIGVDPLADHYSTLYPAWQSRVRTIAAFGEKLPFENESFDVVLSDNVVDHGNRPAKIVEEMVRVLAPGGLLYFTVNVHHPVYNIASSLHAGWRALGIKFEITPFADHTVHLTPQSAQKLFEGLPLRIVDRSENIEGTKRLARIRAPRNLGDLLKRLFYKNALFEMIAVREP
jgi:SAM-dependent methyltransferase